MVDIVENENKETNFEKMSRDDVSNTKICAGQHSFTVEQLENEIKAESEVGMKLKSIENELAKY